MIEYVTLLNLCGFGQAREVRVGVVIRLSKRSSADRSTHMKRMPCQPNSCAVCDIGKLALLGFNTSGRNRA